MTGKFFHRVAVSRWYNSQPGAEPPNGVLVCVTPHLPHHPLETEFILGAASDKSDRREGFAASSPSPLPFRPAPCSHGSFVLAQSPARKSVAGQGDKGWLPWAGRQPGQRSLSFSEVPSRGLCFGLRHDRDRRDRAHHKNMMGFSRAPIIGAADCGG